MNKSQFIKALGLVAVLSLTFTACKEEVEDPHDHNEEELITSVELSFTEDSTTNTVEFKFADPDGDGGNAPTQHDTIQLKANTTYNLSLKFLNESDHVHDITGEVEEEADEHLVCFDVTGSTTVTINDMDGNNLPLGLESTVTTGDSESGSFTVSLKHQPDVKNGSCDVGETDVEVAFVLQVVD